MEDVSVASRNLGPADTSFFNSDFSPSAPPMECDTMWCHLKQALPYVLPLIFALLTYLYIDHTNKDSQEPMDPQMQMTWSVGAAALTFGLTYAFKQYM